MGSWDKGIDFVKTYKMFVRDLRETRQKDNINALKKRLYLVIVLTQLRNGSRIGEAIMFIDLIYRKDLVKNKVIEGFVRVEKKRIEDYRYMVLPKEITQSDLIAVKGLFYENYRGDKDSRKLFVKKIGVWLKYNYGFNTHSLRYALISYLGKKGVSPQLIAKITKHAKLDMILNYTQEKQAINLLKEVEGL